MEPQTGTTKKDQIVRLTILIVGALFILAMTYGSGMRAQVNKIKKINEERKLAEQNYRDAQRKLRFRLAVAQILEARRQVSLSLLELDKRNFGVAGSALKTAVEQLNRAQEINAAIPDLTEVTTRLQAVNTTALSDYATLRNEIVGIAGELDARLTDFVPSFLEESATDDAAHPIEKPSLNDVPVLPGHDVTKTLPQE